MDPTSPSSSSSSAPWSQPVARSTPRARGTGASSSSREQQPQGQSIISSILYPKGSIYNSLDSRTYLEEEEDEEEGVDEDDLPSGIGIADTLAMTKGPSSGHGDGGDGEAGEDARKVERLWRDSASQNVGLGGKGDEEDHDPFLSHLDQVEDREPSSHQDQPSSSHPHPEAPASDQGQGKTKEEDAEGEGEDTSPFSPTPTGEADRTSPQTQPARQFNVKSKGQHSLRSQQRKGKDAFDVAASSPFLADPVEGENREDGDADGDGAEFQARKANKGKGKMQFQSNEGEEETEARSPRQPQQERPRPLPGQTPNEEDEDRPKVKPVIELMSRRHVQPRSRHVRESQLGGRQRQSSRDSNGESHVSFDLTSSRSIFGGGGGGMSSSYIPRPPRKDRFASARIYRDEDDEDGEYGGRTKGRGSVLGRGKGRMGPVALYEEDEVPEEDEDGGDRGIGGGNESEFLDEEDRRSIMDNGGGVDDGNYFSDRLSRSGAGLNKSHLRFARLRQDNNPRRMRDTSGSPILPTANLPTNPSSPYAHGEPESEPTPIQMIQQNFQSFFSFFLPNNSNATGPIHLPGSRGGALYNSNLSPKDRALWRWVNVVDLDGFLQEVYSYYVGKGIWCISLSLGLNLLTIGFVIGFSTFLLGCIDWSIVRQRNKLSDVVVGSCISRFSGFTHFLFIFFLAYYGWRIFSFMKNLRRLWQMHEFFEHLLDIPEADIATIPWHSLVTRLSKLRSSNPSAFISFGTSKPSTSLGGASPSASTVEPRLDAHDVANRIMREENYLIALFSNEELLDLRVPLPPIPLGRWFPSGAGEGEGQQMESDGLEGKKGHLTKALEWNLSFCLLGFLFGKDGQVRSVFASERNRKELIAALRRRFILMGFANAIFAPFIVVYLLLYSFFRYFEEYHKNPANIGSRHYTQLARWKFREFNELPHVFKQRLAKTYPLAREYLDQFPKAKVALLSKFIAFIAGSFASVLVLFSILDPDAFLHFEITPGATVLFYIGIFGTIMAVARGMVPEEGAIVGPEGLIKRIIEHTHYMPEGWKDKLHSVQVHREFGQLFQMKIMSFVQELLSVLTTPFILWFSLPKCAPAIIDFFRAYTIYVDGLGYVCSFAVFDLRRPGDARPSQQQSQPTAPPDDRWVSNHGKMEKSLLNFKAHHPDWNPQDQTASLYLSHASAADSMLNPRATSSSQHHQDLTPNLTRRRSQSRSTRFSPVPEEASAEPSDPAADGRGRRGSRHAATSPIDGDDDFEDGGHILTPSNAAAGEGGQNTPSGDVMSLMGQIITAGGKSW